MNPPLAGTGTSEWRCDLARRVIWLLLLAACGHGETLSFEQEPLGPLTPGLPRRLTMNPRDDMMPSVAGAMLIFARQGDSYRADQYTNLPRESCLALMPAEGGSIRTMLCPHHYLSVSDTLVHTWFEPALSPDGSRVAFNWMRAYDISALGYVDANLLVTSLAQPADSSLRVQLDFIEAGMLPRHADVATEITWIGNDTLRFLSTHYQIIKVKGGGAERVTDTIMRGLQLTELDIATRAVRYLAGGDSVYAYANAPDGAIYVMREPDSTLLLRLDPSTGTRAPVGRFSASVSDIAVLEGMPVAAIAGAHFDIERMDPASGALEPHDFFPRTPLRLAAVNGRRLIAEVETASIEFGAPPDLWLVELP